MRKRSYDKEVVARMNALRGNFDVLKAGTVKHGSASYPLYYIIVKGKPGSQNVFLSAGVHGDEPAGVYALLEFLEKHASNYLDDFSFVAFPCINPGGFEKAIRMNNNGVNLNQNFASRKPEPEVKIIKNFLAEHNERYVFSFDFHEDDIYTVVEQFPVEDNPRGFYLYEISKNKKEMFGDDILKIIEAKGVTVCKQEQIYHDKSQDGLVWYKRGTRRYYEHENTLFGYMQKYTKHSFIAETPTCWPLKKRIKAHITALSSALDFFKKQKVEK